MSKMIAFRSLAGKLIAFVTIAILLLVAVLGYMFYSNTQSAVEDSVSTNAMRLAESIASGFDSASYQAFTQDPQESDMYWSLRERLNDIRQTTGAMYVYTMRADAENKTYVMIDGQPRDSEVASPINEEAYEEGDADYVEKVLAGNLASTPVVEDDEYGTYLSAYAPIKDASGSVIGILGVDIDASDLEAVTNQVVRESGGMYVLILVLAVLILAAAFLYINRTLGPLKKVTAAAEFITNGDFARANALLDDGKRRSQDEVGKLHEASIQMSHQLEGILRRIHSEVAASSDNVATASTGFATNAQSLVSDATRIAAVLRQAAADADVQFNSANEAASSMEEISTGVQRVSEASSTVSDAAASAIEHAENGTRSMGQVRDQIAKIAEASAELVDLVSRLEERSRDIGQVLGIITEHANQTQLLALNASIEAARAGEHGKGFMVVASEVRKLAEQSSKSVESIGPMLLAIQADAREVKVKMEADAEEVAVGQTVTREASDTFRRIVELFRSVTSQIQETSATAQEMSAGTEEVTAAMAEIAHIARKTSEGLREAATLSDQQQQTAQGFASSADGLRETAASLQSSLHAFSLSETK